MKPPVVLMAAIMGIVGCSEAPLGESEPAQQAKPSSSRTSEAKPDATILKTKVEEAGISDVRVQVTGLKVTPAIETVFANESGGVRFRVEVAGLKPGTYGMHVHEIGRCDEPDFTSAGAHWNPASKRHGRENLNGPHMGDLPNLVIGADARGTANGFIAGAKLSDGPNPMLDADGAALLIHAKADDYRTDPSGNSGARIACGVVGKPK